MTTPTPDLVALRELLAKATPGPWDSRIEPQHYPECDDADLPATISGNGQHIAYLPERYDANMCQVNDVDAALVVWLRNNAPSLLDAIERLEREREEAQTLADRLRLEAQMHAGEARAHKATVHEAYQAATNGTGEPGNWHGAQPIRDALTAATARADAAVKERDQAREALRTIWVGDVPRPVGRVYRRDGKPSKLDTCIHSVSMSEQCSACIDTFISQAIGRG